MFCAGLTADAGPLAAFDLVAEAWFSGGGFLQAEQRIAQVEFGGQSAQHLACFLGVLEQAVASAA